MVSNMNKIIDITLSVFVRVLVAVSVFIVMKIGLYSDDIASWRLNGEAVKASNFLIRNLFVLFFSIIAAYFTFYFKVKLAKKEL